MTPPRTRHSTEGGGTSTSGFAKVPHLLDWHSEGLAHAPDENLLRDWPLFGLRLQCGDVALRPVREADLGHLAAIQPDDYEHDPRADAFRGLDAAQHRARLVYQDYWRSMGTWSPDSWSLAFVVENEEVAVGIQSLESESFLDVRIVDSGSWLTGGSRTGSGSGDADGHPRPGFRPPALARGRHVSPS